MSTSVREQSIRRFTVPFGVFIGIFIVGLIVVGTSSPFWQVLLVAVIAGLVGLAAGRAVRNRT